MKPNSMMLTIALLGSALATAAAAQDLGRVTFKTSCTPAAQEKFDRGVALVHSFFFPDTVKAFTEAAAGRSRTAPSPIGASRSASAPIRWCCRSPPPP